MTLTLHKTFQQTFDSLCKDLPQAIVLTGQSGLGLGTLAKTIAGNSLIGLLEPTTRDGSSDHIAGTIKVEAVRDLYQLTRGKSSLRNVVIIDDADHMSPAAQNAFLKLLEEPRKNLSFILTTHQSGKLLPTIRSRANLYAIPPIDPAQTTKLITELDMDPYRQQLEFIAHGMPAELHRLAQDQAYRERVIAVYHHARQYLESSAYDRLRQITAITDRSAALAFCDTLLSILSRTQNEASLEQQQMILEARDAIAQNGSIRLQLLRSVI